MLRTRWESALPAARPPPSRASAASGPPDRAPRLRSGGCRGPLGPHRGLNLIPPLAGEGVDLGAAGLLSLNEPLRGEPHGEHLCRLPLVLSMGSHRVGHD